jgi:hypothetical protein
LAPGQSRPQPRVRGTVGRADGTRVARQGATYEAQLGYFAQQVGVGRPTLAEPVSLEALLVRDYPPSRHRGRDRLVGEPNRLGRRLGLPILSDLTHQLYWNKAPDFTQ